MLIDPIDTPEIALKKIRDELKRAVADKHHKFRFLSLSTIDSVNNSPNTRLVVLRSFFDDGSFEIFTDHRTQKINDLTNNSNATVLFWDPSKNIQVRMQCTSKVHHQTDRTKKEWRNIQGAAQKAYTSILKPGTLIEQPEDAHQWPKEKTDEYFAIIHSIPYQIKVLQLNKTEHFALKYQINEKTKKWEGSWMVP